MADSSDDPVRTLIKDTLTQLGLPMSEVSKRLGKNHAYLHQFLDRRIPSRLPEEVREQLSVILNVPEAQLKGEGSRKRAATSDDVRRGSPTPWDKIDVYTTGQGASDWFSWTGEIVDHIPRPPQVAGATQAYAVYVVGSNMEPRYYAGETLYVHPGKPITAGAFVLVQLNPDAEGRAPKTSMKRFVRRTATKMTFEQFSPSKHIDLKVSDILSIHRIVGSAEGGG